MGMFRLIVADQFSSSAAICPLLSDRVLNGAARGTTLGAMSAHLSALRIA